MEDYELKSQILAAIDDLNQYLLGNVNALGLIDTLKDTINDVEAYAMTIRESKDFDLRKYLAESKLLKENEEQGYTLYTSNVEYDNGKTGYMYQLVNSEDREENEIGFDQLYFDDEDNRLEMGVDFKDFDQGSYQEEEVSAEEAMKIYNELK
jgi:hypothetical protein